MEKSNIQLTQKDAIWGIFTPFIEAIADKVSERVLQATTHKEPRFYTRKETAKLLRITLPTLHSLTKRGIVKSKKISGRVLYYSDAIDEAIQQGTVFKYKRG